MIHFSHASVYLLVAPSTGGIFLLSSGLHWISFNVGRSLPISRIYEMVSRAYQIVLMYIHMYNTSNDLTLPSTRLHRA